MPKYFSRLHNGDTTFDDEGTELTDLRAARAEEIRTCADMLRETPYTLLAGHAWCLWATDQPNDEGAGLFTLTVAMRNGRPTG